VVGVSPGKYDLGDYKEVSERIADLRVKYPDASLSSEVILWPSEALPFIAVKALCYRSRKDENPGVGLAWEPFPGKTPYTRDSELQNAETSAWGRAIVAALASDTKQGIASADEVRNRKAPDATQARASGNQGAEVSATPPSAPASSSGETGTAPEGTVAGAKVAGEEAKAPATELLSLIALYGGKAHLLRAAREQWDVLSLDDLTAPMLAELKRVKSAA
jgi:hypothetical protein